MAEGDANVSWREFVAARAAERQITEAQLARLDQANVDSKERAALALSSSEKAADKHNELIRKMENERAEFARGQEVALLREDVSALRGAVAKIVGASVGCAVLLAVIINLVISLASGG